MTQIEYSRRRRLAASAVAERQLDGLLVSSPANIRYLTGFTGSNALLLLFRQEAILFTDPRYELQAQGEAGCPVRVERGSLFVAAAKWGRSRRLRRQGFEKAHLAHEAFLTLDENLSTKARLVPAVGIVEALRMVKSRAEIESIRRSVMINSEAFDQTLRLIRPGLCEADIAAELEYRMRKLGAENPAFGTIVASGARSAQPHANPTPNALACNELLLIDMGAVRDGYSSDMTRMAFLGRPGAKVKRMYKAVLEAQLAAIAVVREDVTAEAVDRAARRALRSHNLDKAFVHSTGHGLGLEIHELPRLGKGDKTRLRAGMAITIEPGVYLQKFGGIRIEDTVVVTGNGCEILTPTSKELLTI